MLASCLSLGLVEVLAEPVDNSVLSTLKTLLLGGVARVTSGGEAVSEAREVLVVVLNAESGNLGVGVVLELLGVHLVELGRENLDGDADGVDLLLGEKRGVGGGDGIYKLVLLGTQLENGPAACDAG